LKAESGAFGFDAALRNFLRCLHTTQYAPFLKNSAPRLKAKYLLLNISKVLGETNNGC
jgi:hypothetical protein